jgi:6-phosphogluconolactonase (cycloisomerase 2 family)
MRIRWWALLLPAAALLASCGDFWEPPSGNGTTSFSLTNNGNITVTAGSSNTALITVTPANSFTGTVTLSCAVTAPSGATSPVTCALSSSSVSISGTTAANSTLTATAPAAASTGAYELTVTGTSGSVAASTTVCAVVGTSTSSCTSTSSTSGDFYILDAPTGAASVIAGYSIVSDVLTPLGSPQDVTGGAFSMAISPSGNFLYVGSTAGIYVYPITNGVLGAATQISQDPSPLAMQVDPNGRWLLDASAQGVLNAIPITSSGALDTTRSIQSPGMASDTVTQMAIAPKGGLIAVALGTTGTQLFSFTSGNAAPLGNGSNAFKATTSSSDSAVAVAFDSQGRYLYVGETNVLNSTTSPGALSAFVIGSGYNLTPFSNSPYPSGGTGPYAILSQASTGDYVYVANWETSSTGNVTAFQLNSSTPTLTALANTAATGTEPKGLAEDSTGSYVLAVSSAGSNYFNAYTFDATTTGQLDSVSSLSLNSTGSTPIAIVAVP